MDDPHGQPPLITPSSVGHAGKAAAAKLRARVYGGGRDVLREIIKDSATAAAIGQFRFDRTLGAVVDTTAP